MKTGIWIDSTRAVIVALSGDNEAVLEVVSDIENRIYHDHEGDKGSFMGGSHINKEGKFENRREHQINNYLDEVLTNIMDVDEVYIFGPAEMKQKLGKKIESKVNPSFELKAIETADSMTTNQIVAKTKEFFKQ